jgi:hypothetical protein
MMLLKRLFHRSDKQDQELHGLAEAPDRGDQDAIRTRMENEVTRGKEQRAAAKDAADAAAKAPPAQEG